MDVDWGGDVGYGRGWWTWIEAGCIACLLKRGVDLEMCACVSVCMEAGQKIQPAKKGKMCYVRPYSILELFVSRTCYG